MSNPLQKPYLFKKIEHPRFIINLFYASENNAFYKNMYHNFGLSDCLVCAPLYDKLLKLIPILEHLKLKLVIYDTLRPWCVQKYMYETAPDYLKPYIAPPPEKNSLRGFHPRGAAIDCYLAHEDGTPLDFPTLPDAFYPGYEKDETYKDYLKKVNTSYQGKNMTPLQKSNRELLQKIMIQIGLESLPTEWWHFNLPNATQYPIVYDLNDIVIE